MSRPPPKGRSAPRYALGKQAAGGAVLKRGTFQPDNRKQQAELQANAVAEGQRLERVRQAKIAHHRAVKLYKAGNHKGAIALNAHARRIAGLSPTESPGVVGKVIEQTAKDLGQAAYYTPGGLIATGKAVGSDFAKGPGHKPTATRKLAGQMIRQTEESFQHPLRHPGYTGLNVLALLSGGAGAASRLGAAGEALRAGEGVGAAITRPGFRGGSLLHRKPAGEINLPGGVQALEHDNPALRPLQRGRLRSVTKKIDAGVEGSKHFGGQNVIGREVRAREQVLSDIQAAPIEAMRGRVKHLKPEENTALRVIATEGRHALQHPEETIARHVQTHLGYAEQGIEPKLNRAIAEDLGKALPVLKARDPKFLQAVAAVRRVSRTSERQLVGGERLTKEAANARLAKIAQAYGHPNEGVPKGSFYFPTGERFKFPTNPVRTGAAGRRPGPAGLGPVDASRYTQGTLRQFTGKGLRRGVVQRPGEAIASRAAGTQRLASAERVHGSLLKLATPEPRSQYDVLIRAKRGISPDQRRTIAAAMEEARTGDQTALVRATKKLEDSLRPSVGEKGVYVDRRYLKDIAGGTGSVLARGGAAFNKPFRFGGVYFRPAYVVTNRPQNFLMRKLGQGLRSRKPIHGTVGSVRTHLGEELSAKIDAAAGTTRTESYNPQRLAGRVERGITSRISDATDRNERFLAVLARAYEKGYRNEGQLRRLFAEQAPEKVVNDRVAIARRASKDMVDFRSVTPGEHELADLIYFYPWLSRGSAWAGRFVAQHPIKSAALASTAPTGEQQQRGALGPVPGWMKGYIPTRFGVSNPAGLNTFETPAQIGQTLANPSGPQARSFGEEFGTPIVQALTTQPKQLPQRAQSSLAPGLLLQRLGVLGKTPKTFPQTGIGPALGPFVFGGPYPRKPDRAEVNKQALHEMPAPKRVVNQIAEARTTILTAAKKIDPEAAPILNSEFKVYERRYGAYAKAGAKTSLDRYKVDAQLLVQMGQATPAEAKAGIAWAEKATPDDLRKQRAAISKQYFSTPTLSYAAKKLGVSLPR